MFFWKHSSIPKELREHINKTINKAMSEKYPGNPKYDVEEFINKSQNIISGSMAIKKQREDMQKERLDMQKDKLKSKK
jgi:hypothetical protein